MFENEKVIDIDDLPISSEEKESLKDKQDTLKATVKIESNSKKVTIKSDFVIAFTENLSKLAEIGVNQTELRVILYILEKMKYGNLIGLNQASVCTALNLKRSNVSNVFKKLKLKQVLIEDEEKNLYMNSKLFVKGLSHRLDEDKRTAMKKNQANLFDDEKEKVINLKETI